MVHGFSLQDIKSVVRPRFRASRAALVIVLPRCQQHLPPSSITMDAALIHRRHVLGLLAAASILPSRSFANVAPQRSEIREDLAKRFTDEGTAGTFVGYKTDDYLLIASDKERSGQAMLPASTFKIPNSLIALETNVVVDPDKDVFKWDGVVRSIEGWNRDHTLRSAIAASVVPVYQEIARRIGAERMQKYLDLFEYGNRDILPVTKAGDSVIRAKTGLLGAELGKPSLGWVVGWAEKGSSQTVFALNVDVRESRHIASR